MPSLMTMLMAGAVLAQPSPATPEQLAAGARAVFAAKCVDCHGPDLPHPRSNFGFVTDLARLVSKDGYVVPGRPEDSELWKQVSSGDMPPDGARAGALTRDDLAAINAWIVAGAPAPAAKNPPSTLVRGVTLLGKAHLLVLHFPVVLLTLAGLAEAKRLARHKAGAIEVFPLVCAGAGFGVLAAALGWARALDGYPGPFASPGSTVWLHRWLGTAVGVGAPLLAGVLWRTRGRAQRPILVSAGVILMGVLVAAAAHFGGLLSHGAHFFDP